MPSVNLLIKPASSLCNMRCRYCFYADEAAHRALPSMGRMQPDTARLLIQRALEAAGETGSVSFSFQGGEPTLAGLPFFEQFTETVRTLNSANRPIHYGIQTNGLAVDAAWAKFLAEHHFLVGISLDGDKALHDSNRVDAAGRGTWARVCQSLTLLQKAGADCNLLCVVTRRCARGAVRTYHALQKTGVRYLQFIPCLDPLGEARGQRPWSLTPQDYGSFLCTLFDEWYRDWRAGNYTSVRLFDDYVHRMMGLPAGTCSTTGSCGGYLAAEADGGIYPCDFYVLDAFRLGSIREASLPDLQQSACLRRFLDEGQQPPAECAACGWKSLCQGGCQRDRFWDGAARHNYYCPSFRRFFAHAAVRLQEIAAAELRAAQR